MKLKIISLIIVFVLIVGIVVVLVYNNNNSLLCSKTYDNEITKLNIKFKNNKPNTLLFEKSILFNDIDAYIEMKYLEETNNYAILDNIKGLQYKIKKLERKNKIIVKINIDYNIYDINTNTNQINIPVMIDNLENNKSYLENIGYTCK